MQCIITWSNKMYNFTREDIDIEAIRERTRKMRDDDLLEHGKAAAFMASRDSRETWKMQLAEARAEWRRRHPKADKP